MGLHFTAVKCLIRYLVNLRCTSSCNKIYLVEWLFRPYGLRALCKWWKCNNMGQCSGKRVQQLKNVKSCFLDFQKNVKTYYNFWWLFNVYCSSSLLSESNTAQRSHSMFSNGSEWITLADLGTDTSFQKKRKKSCFLKSEKNVKYVFSNSDMGLIFALTRN